MADSNGRHFKLPELGNDAAAAGASDAATNAAAAAGAVEGASSAGVAGSSAGPAHSVARGPVKKGSRTYWVLDDVDLDLDDVSGETSAPASHFSKNAAGVKQVETAYGRHARAAGAADVSGAAAQNGASSSVGRRFRAVSSDLVGGTASTSAARAHARGNAPMREVKPLGAAPSAAPLGASSGGPSPTGVSTAGAPTAGASSGASDPGLTSEFIAAAYAGGSRRATAASGDGTPAGATASEVPTGVGASHRASAQSAASAAESIGRIHTSTPVPAAGTRFKGRAGAGAGPDAGAARAAGAQAAASSSSAAAGSGAPGLGASNLGASSFASASPQGAGSAAPASSSFGSDVTTTMGVTTAQPAYQRSSARHAAGASPMGAPVISRGPARGVAGHGAAEDEESAPKRRRTALDILSTALIVVGVVLLLGAGGVLVKALLGYREAETVYDDLEQYAVVDEDGGEYPIVDFEALAAINSDIVGWIYIPGTQINYPVVQTDDNSTYLTKLFDDTSNTNGTIFMDYEDTAPGMVDQQTTLYGHHMNDGSMFKFIDNALDQDDFDTIDVVYYITADATYVLKPLCTTQVDETYLDVREANFTSEAVFRTYLRTMLSNASAVADDAEERISDTTQVLSLVTCAGEVIPRTTRAVMICTIEEVITTE